MNLQQHYYVIFLSFLTFYILPRATTAHRHRHPPTITMNPRQPSPPPHNHRRATHSFIHTHQAYSVQLELEAPARQISLKNIVGRYFLDLRCWFDPKSVSKGKTCTLSCLVSDVISNACLPAGSLPPSALCMFPPTTTSLSLSFSLPLRSRSLKRVGYMLYTLQPVPFCI